MGTSHADHQGFRLGCIYVCRWSGLCTLGRQSDLLSPFPSSASAAGRATQGWTRDEWVPPLPPTAMWGWTMQGTLRKWSRGEVVYENTLVKHGNAVCPWDVPPWTSLRWQLKFAEPAKNEDGRLFKNTMDQAKMYSYINVWLSDCYYESPEVGP